MNRNLENAMTIKQLELRKNMLWRFDVARKVFEMNNKVNMQGSAGLKGPHWIGQVQ